MKESLAHIAPILHSLKEKKNPFAIPKGYFDTLEQEVLSKTNENSFTIPEGYFEQLDEAIFDKIKQENSPKTIKLSRFNIYTLASIAAAIVIYFSIIKQDNSSLNEESIIAYLELEEDMLSTYDIASALDDDTLETISLKNIDASTIEAYLEDDLDELDL